MNRAGYIVGVDTGGTFTDVAVLDRSGKITVGKAESTPPDFTAGVIHAVQDAAAKLDLALADLLPAAEIFAQGCTIGTNAIINRSGVRTGILTTRGFEDTIFIQRGAMGKNDGLHPDEVRHLAVTRKPLPLVPGRWIKGVNERVDYRGQIIAGLKPEEVEKAARELIAEGVRSIAVCFLWSQLNPRHEQAAREVLHRIAPEIYVSISSEVSPLIGEYERFNAAVCDAYIGPVMTAWYRNLNNTLRSKGFAREILAAQAWGGIMPLEGMLPVSTISSGPAGGVAGSVRIAEILGTPNVVTTDVGGTSFDAGLIVQNKFLRAREGLIDRFRVNMPMVDVSSIGAGGGSIAWVDLGGALKVGPVSAQAVPGPACYMRGGTHPTVTDAEMVLGIINPDYYLGGRMKVDKEASAKAVRELGEKIGLGVMETASAIFEIQNEHMADLLRLVVTRAGYHPRDFVVYCFGGGGPVHGPFYGKELGFRKIYIFPTSAVWCAFGLASSDIMRVFARSVYYRMPADPAEINRVFEEMEKGAVDQMAKIGFAPGEMVLTREMSLKFARQISIETIYVPGKKYTAPDIDAIASSFIDHYKKLYGQGSALMDAGIEVISLYVTVQVPSQVPALIKQTAHGDPSASLKGRREVFWKEKGGFHSTQVFDGERLPPGAAIQGPAIIELPTTTVLVPARDELKVNEYGFYVIES